MDGHPITHRDLDYWDYEYDESSPTGRLITLVRELAHTQANSMHPNWCMCGPDHSDDPKCPVIKARALLPKKR